MYNILAESYSGPTGKGQFHLSMIKQMQMFTSSRFESIFIEYYPLMYENTIMNNRFRWMLINWMKNKFLTDWIFKLISQMKNQISTSVGTSESQLTGTAPVILNDNDVNKMFGWALFKVKKKYQKKLDNDNADSIQNDKLLMINELSVKIEDVIHNKFYVQMYYPTDEAIRNRGDLTLIEPIYIKYFSNILNNIKQIMEGIDSINKKEIPDQNEVIKRLKINGDKNESDDINGIVTLIKSNMKLKFLIKTSMKDVIWELIIRVIHATIGNKVRRYRRQALLRLNTVAFRTELAVKSEHK